jgi:hypothetical protein
MSFSALHRALLRGSVDDVVWQIERAGGWARLVEEAEGEEGGSTFATQTNDPTDELIQYRLLSLWLEERSLESAHSDPTCAHRMAQIDWRTKNNMTEEEELTPELFQPQLTLMQLIHALYSLSSALGAEHEQEFEFTLIELKRQILLDRLTHSPSHAAFTSHLHTLLPLAVPEKTNSSVSRAFGWKEPEGVWKHDVSEQASEAERKVFAEMEQLWQDGGGVSLLKYLTEHPWSDVASRIDAMLKLALQRWGDKHAPKEIGAAAPATKSTPQKPSKAAPSGSKKKSPAASIAAPLASPSPRPAAKSSASPTPAARSSAWTYDDLVLTSTEIESLLTPSMYSALPVVLSQQSASMDDVDAEAQPAKERVEFARKRAAFKPIFEQTHPEIVHFLKQRKPSTTQPSAVTAKPSPPSIAVSSRSKKSAFAAAAAGSRKRPRMVESEADLFLTQQPIAGDSEEEDNDEEQQNEDVEMADGESMSDDEEPIALPIVSSPASTSKRARTTATSVASPDTLKPLGLLSSKSKFESYFSAGLKTQARAKRG